MPRIPYEQIAPEANKIFAKITSAPNLKVLRYWWETYVAFLNAAGWDPTSFEQEEARRIDEGWEETKPVIWN